MAGHMPLYGGKREKHGTIDRELIVFETEVDGPITADGPLLTKWADPKGRMLNRSCVIAEAEPTERRVWHKCCYTPVSLWVCQNKTDTPNQAVTYTVEAVADDGTVSPVHSVVVIGHSEVRTNFHNATYEDGEEVYHKNLRVSVATGGGNVDAMVWFGVGAC